MDKEKVINQSDAYTWESPTPRFYTLGPERARPARARRTTRDLDFSGPSERGRQDRGPQWRAQRTGERGRQERVAPRLDRTRQRSDRYMRLHEQGRQGRGFQRRACLAELERDRQGRRSQRRGRGRRSKAGKSASRPGWTAHAKDPTVTCGYMSKAGKAGAFRGELAWRSWSETGKAGALREGVEGGGARPARARRAGKAPAAGRGRPVRAVLHG